MLHSLTTKNKLIVSRTLAYTMTSPFDLLRQNMLTNNTITKKKFINGAVAATGISITFSNICYSLIDSINARNKILGLMTGILLMNLISTPVIYMYKHILIGRSLRTLKMLSIRNSKRIFLLSLLDDTIEESFKFLITNNILIYPYHCKFLDAMIITLITYPTDIIKNKITYCVPLTINNVDPIIRFSHKLIQSYIFISMFNLLS